MIKVDIQCNQAEQSAEPLTQESEKEMEFNTIMQALVKDLAEQLRPLVADMVRVELATHASDNLSHLPMLSDTQLAYIAEHLSDTQLVTVGENIILSDLAAELTEGQLHDIAGEIDLSDLAGELDNDKLLSNVDIDKLMENIDVDKLLENVDLDEKLRDFFSNNTFSIRP